MSIIDWYYEKSRNFFAGMLQLLSSDELTKIQRIELVKYLIRVAQFTNEYASPVLEKSLCDIADTIDVVPVSSSQVQKGSVLHVATKLKNYGGHARLLERWIELDTQFSNDVVLLESSSEIPSKLTTLCQLKGTKVFVLEDSDDLTKAGRLRSLASNYEFVVLHVIHIEVIHMLAFGTTKFVRPILFMNHTDHLFWLGGMIADRILNMSSRACEFTKLKRGRDDGAILPIPLSLEDVDDNFSKSAVRENLGIGADSKVIFSCGHFYKYNPISFFKSFHWLLYKILRGNSNVTFVVVGINPNTLAWKILKFYFGSRLILFKSCSHKELNGLMRIADLYLDSYPISGFTALCEALEKDIPIIPIDTGFSYFDSFFNDAVKEEYAIEKVNFLLSSEITVDGETQLSSHLNDEWLKVLHSIIKNTPEVHSLHEIKPCSVAVVDLDRTFFYQFGGQAASLKFIFLRFPLSVKIKILYLYLSQPVYLFISLLIRIRILFFRVVF